jgi:hypothetical protein
MREDIIIGILTWIVGIIISLAVGSGMIDGTLIVPGIPEAITIIAGWIVVIGAIISLIMTIFKK